MVTVEGHRLYIDIGIEQLGAPHLGSGAIIQNILGCLGQVDPQILDAVFVPTAVGDFTGVDGKSLLQIFTVAAHASGATL